MLDHEKEIFEALNERLKEEGITLTVVCVGGFVLNHYGMRATVDVDAFYDASKKINNIIREIGDMFNINTEDELWLNNSVQNMNARPPERLCETLYAFSNLQVLIPPLEYVACMKLLSAREQDVEDVAAIIKKLSIKLPEDMLKMMKTYKLDRPDESVLLEAFGLAYGMDWLENYYIKNEEKIQKRIKEGQ